MVYLTADQVWLIHVMILLNEALDRSPEPPSLESLKALIDKDTSRMRPELLDSAVFVPQQPYYSNFWQRAAALLRSLVKNHAFFDGNKRTALIALEVFLDLNGYTLVATQKHKVRFTIGVARGSRLWSIESWLRNYARSVQGGKQKAAGRLQRWSALIDDLGLRRPFASSREEDSQDTE